MVEKNENGRVKNERKLGDGGWRIMKARAIPSYTLHRDALMAKNTHLNLLKGLHPRSTLLRNRKPHHYCGIEIGLGKQALACLFEAYPATGSCPYTCCKT